MNPSSEFACENCNDEGEYDIITGHVDHIDSRGGYHGSDQTWEKKFCHECPWCAGCKRQIGRPSSLAGVEKEWGYFHPVDMELPLYWCSHKCLIDVMKEVYKQETEDN